MIDEKPSGKCNNCQECESVVVASSGLHLCKTCAERIDHQLTKIKKLVFDHHMYDVLRDERQLGEFEKGRFSGCVSSCESIGHSSCRCRSRRW